MSGDSPIVLPRRRVLRAGLAAGAGLLIRPAGACEFFARTLRVTHPWTRASERDATSAVVSMRFDEVSEDERLVGVETPIAEGSELGDAQGGRSPVDLAIPKGRETRLAENGTFLRLTGLQMPLEIGRSYPLRLVFARAGTLRADLSIDYGRFY